MTRSGRDPLVVAALLAGVASLVVASVTLVVVLSADHAPAKAARPSAPAPPEPPAPSGAPGAPGGTVRPSPSTTRLAWRSERLQDGSENIVVGDVDAAPMDPDRIGGSDYRSDGAKIIKVHGWWCVTRAPGRLSLAGGRLRGIGISTQCSGRPSRMRERYRFTRSSWTGMRSYTDDVVTPWTRAQDQRSGALSVPCPAGRTGTYDYQLSVTLEIDGRVVGVEPARSDDGFRGDCGTGVS